MTWIARLRLLTSVLLVLALAAGLSLVFNQRQRQSASVSAAIVQPRYAIAAVAPGVVIDMAVALGDDVSAGDVLFTMTSVELQQDAVHGLAASSNDAMDIDPVTGVIVYRATADGRVTELSATPGNYLGAGAPVATIVRSSPRAVEAQFLLTSRDYGRLEEGARAEILLPDDRTVIGDVVSASVVTEDGKAVSRALITSEELEGEDLDLIATDGAPVSVRVELTDDGVLAGPTDALMDFLRSVGLR